MKYLKRFRTTILFFIAYLVLVLAIYFVESGRSEANITSFFEAIWYSLVTLTTVGYGDYYPVTQAGRVLGFFLLLGSLGLLGALVGNINEQIKQLKERRKMGYNGTGMENHIVIIGWDTFAHSVVSQLIKAGRKTAIVTENKEDIDFIYEEFSKEEVFVLYTDLKNIQILEKVNIGSSTMVFINVPGDTQKLISVLNIRKSFSDATFLVTLEESDLKDTFYSAGVHFVLSKNEIASKIIASYIFEPDVADYSNDLMSTTNEDLDFDIQQYKVMKNNPYVNQAYGEVFADLKQKYNIVTIGIAKNQNGSRRLLKIPDNDITVEVGDYLIMILNRQRKQQIHELFNVKEGLT